MNIRFGFGLKEFRLVRAHCITISHAVALRGRILGEILQLQRFFCVFLVLSQTLGVSCVCSSGEERGGQGRTS